MSKRDFTKFHLGCDVDDVIADADGAFRKELSHLLGRPIRRNEITDFRYENCLPSSPETVRSVLSTILSQPDKIAPIPGAVEAIRNLSRSCHIYLFTGREGDFRSATLAWLQQHEISYDKITFEKESTSRWKGMDFFVEDDPIFAQRLASHAIRVFLFDAPWNSQVSISKLLVRVASWEEIVKKIESFVTQTRCSQAINHCCE